MTRGLGWVLALVMLTGCQSTPPQSPTASESTAEPSAAITAEPSAATTAEPTAEPPDPTTVGDDLDRLLEALPTDQQLHGYKGNGFCRTEADECDWPLEYGKYLAGTSERDVPLGVSVEWFEGNRDQAKLLGVYDCPEGPYVVSPQESRGFMLGNEFGIDGEQAPTKLRYGDFSGLACDRAYTYALPPDVPRSTVKVLGGPHEDHQAVLSNGFYAVQFGAPDHDLLLAMVAEYFERAGLP